MYVDKKSKIQGTTRKNNGLGPWPLAAQIPRGRGACCIAGAAHFPPAPDLRSWFWEKHAHLLTDFTLPNIGGSSGLSGISSSGDTG